MPILYCLSSTWLTSRATTQQLDLSETLFDVQAAIGAAAICDDQVTKLGGTLFRSLNLAPLKPSFNRITAHFADEDFEFVANSVVVYDVDHALLLAGGAGPQFLKSSVYLAGTFSKSQVGRIIAIRRREELGGITAAEWKAARSIQFRTTVLALNTEPGMVCSMTHPDVPAGAGEFRVTGCRLNNDYSIDIQGRTTTNSMYDLVAGPKPANVTPDDVPDTLRGATAATANPDAGADRILANSHGCIHEFLEKTTRS